MQSLVKTEGKKDFPSKQVNYSCSLICTRSVFSSFDTLYLLN